MPFVRIDDKRLLLGQMSLFLLSLCRLYFCLDGKSHQKIISWWFDREKKNTCRQRQRKNRLSSAKKKNVQEIKKSMSLLRNYQALNLNVAKNETTAHTYHAFAMNITILINSFLNKGFVDFDFSCTRHFKWSTKREEKKKTLETA